MKNSLLALVSIVLIATFSIASGAPLDKAANDDIARHRAMASAHEAAAKCLEAGKKDEVCEKELQQSCKGLAIGKF